MSETQALIQVVNGELIQGTQYQIALADLAERAKLVTHVDNANMYAEAVEICARAKSYIRSIEASAEPERLRLQGELADLRLKRDMFTKLFLLVIEPLEKMANAWKAAERKAAQLEQDTLNKRRNGQEQIHVAPNIPAVPGARAHVNYSAELQPGGEQQIIDAYRKARANGTKKDLDRAAYLRQFITIDQQALNLEARKVKSAKKLESMIPGIKGIETDRI